MGHILTQYLRHYTDKKENQIFLLYKEIQRDRLQSHIWLTDPSNIVKYLRISSYIRKPFHLNFLIYEENFDFLFYQCKDFKGSGENSRISLALYTGVDCIVLYWPLLGSLIHSDCGVWCMVVRWYPSLPPRPRQLVINRYSILASA
jgi:hypothetical protein